MKKCLRIISLILALEMIFANISYAQECEILTLDKPVMCCEGEQIIGEKVEEMPYSPIFDEFINSGISLLADQTSKVETVYSLIYDILKEHPEDMLSEANGIVFPLGKLGYKLSQSEFQTVLNRIMYENGDLFVSKSYTYSTTKDEKYITSVCFYYFVAPSNIDATLSRINAKVQSFIDTVNTDELSDFEKVLLTHDYLSSITRYKVKTDIGTTDQFHSMYGLFTRGICVCQGYTEAMIFLLKQLGIDSGAVVCDKIDHVWNCVKVDNKWYHLDLTWDDIYTNYVDANGDIVLNIDSVRYDSFLKGIDDVIESKEEGVDGYLYSDGDFFYPSFGIDDEDTDNYDYNEGYLTDGFDVLPIGLKGADGSMVYEKLEPKGFFYIDGKFVKQINSNQLVFPKTSYFESDSLKKLNISVSLPFKSSDGCYNFLSYAYTSDGVNQNGINMLVKNIFDMDWNAEKIVTNYKLMVGNYKITYINDSELISNIDNSVLTEIFVWDENMKPLSYKISK